MPRKRQMTWMGEPKYRWRKIHKGKRYYFYPAIKSETASLPEANEWWKAKLRELQSIPEVDSPELRTLKKRLAWAKQNDPKEIPAIKKQIAELKTIVPAPPTDLTAELSGVIPTNWGTDAELRSNMQLANEMGIIITPEAPPALVEFLFGKTRIWQDRFARLPDDPTTEETIEPLIERWLVVEEARKIDKTTIRGKRKPLKTMVETWGDISPRLIDEKKLEELRVKLQRHYNTNSFKVHWSTVKAFVSWLFQTFRLDQKPRNFDATPTLPGVASKKETFTVEEIGLLLAKADPVMKTCIMIALNTGMYTVDIAALDRSQYDGKTLTAKRQKLKGKEKAPTVTYALWGRTIKLIEKNAAKAGRMLSSAKGRSLNADKKGGGRDDKLGKDFSTFVKEVLPGSKGTWKYLRKTCSSILHDSEHHEITNYFLAETPRPNDMVRGHYAKEAQNRLAKAIAYLETQFFPAK